MTHDKFHDFLCSPNCNRRNCIYDGNRQQTATQTTPEQASLPTTETATADEPEHSQPL